MPRRPGRRGRSTEAAVHPPFSHGVYRRVLDAVGTYMSVVQVSSQRIGRRPPAADAVAVALTFRLRLCGEAGGSGDRALASGRRRRRRRRRRPAIQPLAQPATNRGDDYGRGSGRRGCERSLGSEGCRVKIATVAPLAYFRRFWRRLYLRCRPQHFASEGASKHCACVHVGMCLLRWLSPKKRAGEVQHCR